jgi:hypothetical protein
MTTTERISSKNIGVPDDSHGTHIDTEYGCRFPDGHHEWGTFVDNGGVRHEYASIIPGSHREYSTRAMQHWQNMLTERAKRASIHPAEFIEEHTLIKRTVILVTTAAEEV